MIAGAVLIPLRNKEGNITDWAIIDSEREDLLKFTWCKHSTGRAMRTRIGKESYLHREIFGHTKSNKSYIKFKNKDKLDCRIKNLYEVPRLKDINWRDVALRKQYGISEEEYNSLLNSQDNKCIICGFVPEILAEKILGRGKTSSKNRYLVVDHCHETGRIRGLLCFNCNVGLGNFRDKKENLKNAIEYLGG